MPATLSQLDSELEVFKEIIRNSPGSFMSVRARKQMIREQTLKLKWIIDEIAHNASSMEQPA
jgi:hypothetical protein